MRPSSKSFSCRPLPSEFPILLSLDALDPKRPGEVGGKAGNLARLIRHGLPVPPGFVLTGAAYRRARGTMPPGGRLRFSVPGDLREEIRVAAEQLLATTPGTDPSPLVVRSSARGEDSGTRSFAGIYDSFPCSGNLDDLLDKIVQCWDSLWSGRAAAYRGGPPGENDYMAVVVQLRIEPVLAGVIFTRHPTTDGADSLIEVVGGHGESLVDGTANALRFRVARREPHAARPIVPAGGHSPLAGPVPAELLAVVERLALAAEDLLGAPQDVEWVQGRGGVYIVQSRPVTGQSVPAAVETPEPGFVRALDEPFTPFGAWLETEKAMRYQAAVRRIKGPGYAWQARFLNGYLHLREDSTRTGRLYERIVAPLFWLAQGAILDRHQAAVRAYRSRLAALRKKSRETDEPATLHALLGDLCETYLRFAGSTSIAAGHLANLLAGLLARITTRVSPADAASARELLVGITSIIQERDEQLWNAARKADPEERQRALVDWDARFGYFWADRNAKDAGWEIAANRRAAFLDRLAAADPRASPAARRASRAACAVAAERLFAERLRAYRPAWSRPLFGALFRLVLRQAREFFPLRENRNHDFYSGVMAIRSVLGRLGRSLVARGMLESPLDACELSYTDLGQLVRGDCEMAETAAERRRARRRRESTRGAPRLATEDRGAPLHGVAASRGTAEGIARVVTGWDEAGSLQDGEILVCPSIRPYLTPLLLIAAGLVTDRGSALSHGANLAREYGIPAVLSTGDATARIESGDRLRVDGSRGQVTVLRRGQDTPPG